MVDYIRIHMYITTLRDTKGPKKSMHIRLLDCCVTCVLVNKYFNYYEAYEPQKKNIDPKAIYFISPTPKQNKEKFSKYGSLRLMNIGSDHHYLQKLCWNYPKIRCI